MKNLWKNQRKGERWLVGIEADYTLYSRTGECIHHGTLNIENASQGGLGIRANCPFMAGDVLQVRFFYGYEPYAIEGVITRPVSWGRKTGLRFTGLGSHQRTVQQRWVS